MTINFSEDLLTIGSLIFGILGFLVAVYQTFTARKQKELYEEKCSTRCKDLVSTVASLSENAIGACEIADIEMVRMLEGNIKLQDIARPITNINTKIGSIMTLTRELSRFCERLNDEHEQEFGRLVFDCDDELIKRLGMCLKYRYKSDLLKNEVIEN